MCQKCSKEYRCIVPPPAVEFMGHYLYHSFIHILPKAPTTTLEPQKFLAKPRLSPILCSGLPQPACHGLAEHSHPGPQRMPYSPPGSHMGSAEARGADRVTLLCTAVQPSPLLAKVRQWRWQEILEEQQGSMWGT